MEVVKLLHHSSPTHPCHRQEPLMWRCIYLFQGRKAVCNLACEGLSGASTTSDQAQRKIFIWGLAPDVTNEVLLNFFRRYGEIEEGSVAYDKETGESRYKNIYHTFSCFG